MSLVGAISKARVSLVLGLSSEVFAGSQELPPSLYHYTDAVGLEGILTTGKIWATHALYVNDPREIIHAHEILKRAIADSRKPVADLQKHHFLEDCSHSFEREIRRQAELPEAYFASFSAKKDDLSQYRAYSDGGAGYCLGFAAEKLAENARQSEQGKRSSFRLVHMNYDENHQEEVMRSLLDKGWNEVKGIVDHFAEDDPEKVSRRIAVTCVQSASRMGICFKQPGFHVEDEWRIIPSPIPAPEVSTLGFTKQVRIRDGLFVPYLEIPVADENGVTSLKEIYIGPKLPFGPARLGLENLPAFQEVLDSGAQVEIKRSATFLQ